MGETVLDEAAFKSIARLPSREVLVGQFAGLVASPLTGVVRGLNALIQGLATQLGQIAEKGLVTGEAPAAETSTEEPVAEAPAEDQPAAEAEAGEDSTSEKDSNEEEG
jgi:large subunit ribosomal protein L10